MKSNETKKKLNALLRGRGFYAAAAAVLLAAGVLGRTVTSLKAALPKTAEPQTAAQSETTVFRSPTASPTTEAPSPATVAESPAPSEQAVFENQTPTTAPAEETTAAAPTSFSLPVNGGVLADYSMGVPVFSATMGDYRTHNGVDFAAAQGETVRTVAPGTVVSVAEDRLYGNVVTVDHGGGVTSTVCGLANEGLVRVGAVLAAGDALGVAGEIPAESKEESHIHLEMRENGVLTDPLSLLGLDAGAED